MINQRFLLLVLSFCLLQHTDSMAQVINWESLNKSQKHLAYIHTGWDYGLVFGAGYGYHLQSKFPVILTAQFSVPSGKNLSDDFKTKAGGQIRIYETGNLQLSTAGNVIYRQFSNPLVNLRNIGMEAGLTAGYYREGWFVAVELNWDKPLVTHFRHSDIFKESIYPDAKDGWGEPTQAGNIGYGIQAGKSGRRYDVTLKVGKVVAQDFKTIPLIPYFLQLGLNLRMGK